MAGSVAIICIYTVMNHNPERVAIMAKQKEKLSEKRYQNLMCAPSYRKEILDLGNEGRNMLDDPDPTWNESL